MCPLDYGTSRVLNHFWHACSQAALAPIRFFNHTRGLWPWTTILIDDEKDSKDLVSDTIVCHCDVQVCYFSVRTAIQTVAQIRILTAVRTIVCVECGSLNQVPPKTTALALHVNYLCPMNVVTTIRLAAGVCHWHTWQCCTHFPKCNERFGSSPYMTWTSGSTFLPLERRAFGFMKSKSHLRQDRKHLS